MITIELIELETKLLAALRTTLTTDHKLYFLLLIVGFN